MRKWATAIAVSMAFISLCLMPILFMSRERNRLTPVIFICGLASIGYLLFSYLIPEIMYGPRRIAEDRVAQLRKESRLGAGWAFGSIRSTAWTPWVFRWAVRAEGIEILPIPIPPFAIYFSEIERLDCRTGILMSAMTLRHHATYVIRPLRFLMPKWTAVKFALIVNEGMEVTRRPGVRPDDRVQL